jgi:hypothetical protein
MREQANPEDGEGEKALEGRHGANVYVVKGVERSKSAENRVCVEERTEMGVQKVKGKSFGLAESTRRLFIARAPRFGSQE